MLGSALNFTKFFIFFYFVKDFENLRKPPWISEFSAPTRHTLIRFHVRSNVHRGAKISQNVEFMQLSRKNKTSLHLHKSSVYSTKAVKFYYYWEFFPKFQEVLTRKKYKKIFSYFLIFRPVHIISTIFVYWILCSF